MDHLDIDWGGRPVRIETRWLRAERSERPLMIFLHEGLGSVAMWRDFPQQLCEAADLRGLVYSRPGYGRSTPRAADEHWAPDFMHRQALEVLPALMKAAGVDSKPWLFGHSDGGSIALIHAACFPEALAGVVVAAPHILVEAFGLVSIRKARDAYAGGLRERLARYHDDPDSAFFGWNDAWLDDRFKGWTIEDMLHRIRCPVLAVQGLGDEYGTLEQIRGIARRAPQTELLELDACGHSPHRDQPELLIRAVCSFVERQAR